MPFSDRCNAIKFQYPSWLPWWVSWQRIRLQCGRLRFNPWVGKISWRRELATLSSILVWRIPWTEELGGYSPWGHKESDMTEWITVSCLLGFYFLTRSGEEAGWVLLVLRLAHCRYISLPTPAALLLEPSSWRVWRDLLKWGQNKITFCPSIKCINYRVLLYFLGWRFNTFFPPNFKESVPDGTVLYLPGECHTFFFSPNHAFVSFKPKTSSLEKIS